MSATLGYMHTQLRKPVIRTLVLAVQLDSGPERTASNAYIRRTLKVSGEMLMHP